MPALIESLSLTGHEWSLRVYTSRFEATNVTVLARGARAWVIDAPYFPDEIAALPRAVAELGATEVTLVVTHSHFDHLLGRYAFPDAPMVVGAPTARQLAQDADQTLAQLEEFDSGTYVTRPGPLRFWPLEGVAVPGEREGLQLIPAPGHTADGMAVRIAAAGVVCVGDYLSDIEIPLISRAGSPEHYRATLDRLRPIVADCRYVVPGHGTPCGADEALRRLDADAAYLDSGMRTVPRDRDAPRQREIHAANLDRHA